MRNGTLRASLVARLSTILTTAALVASGLVALAPAPSAQASAGSIYDQANSARTSAGAPRLARSSALDAVAQRWTEQMAATGNLSHNPSYSKQIPSGWARAGENVGYASSAAELHKAWMNSPGHKANILSTGFNSVGIGYKVDSRGRVWGTQVFASYPGVTSPTPVRSALHAGFPRDWQGDGKPDVLATDTAGRLYLYAGSGAGGFKAGRDQVGHGWTGRDLLTLTGDWDGDRRPDLIARAPADGALWLYRGDGSGGFLSSRKIGHGWNGIDNILSPADWNGDGVIDILARRARDGALILYPGTGRGGFQSARQVGTKWQSMSLLSVAGDWNGDSKPDIVARDRAGSLFLYPGDGRGGFNARQRIGTGWNTVDTLVGPGDWDGDSRPDLLAVMKDGTMRVYAGNGRGGFKSSTRVGAGWSSYSPAS